MRQLNWRELSERPEVADAADTVVVEDYRVLRQGRHFDQWYRVQIFFNPTSKKFYKVSAEDWYVGKPPQRWKEAEL